MKILINGRTVEINESVELELFEAGEYPAVITGVEYAQNTYQGKQQEQLWVTYKLETGDGPEEFQDRLFIDGQLNSRFQRFLRALHGNHLPQNWDAEELIGFHGSIRLEEKTSGFGNPYNVATVWHLQPAEARASDNIFDDFDAPDELDERR